MVCQEWACLVYLTGLASHSVQFVGVVCVWCDKLCKESEIVMHSTSLMQDGYLYYSEILADRLLEINPQNPNYNYRKGFIVKIFPALPMGTTGIAVFPIHNLE